jgi:membrane protease YdiL (CAAX protease family)
MGWLLSLVYFCVAGVLSIVAHHVVTPMLAANGMQPFYAEFIPGTIVLASLLASAIVAYWLEGRPMTWAGIKDRLRLTRMTGRHWLWVLGGTIVGFILYYLFSPLGSWLIVQGILPMPDSLPAWVDPRVGGSFVEKFNMEAGGVRGNWMFFFMAAITFFFNIVGEEFWWRGYVLPRQELALGKWTWLIHGVMWSALFHAWKYWDVIGMLPADLVFVYVVTRTKSTTVGMWLHIFTNVSFPIFVLLGVLGVGM